MNAEQFLKLSKEGENSRLEYKTCTEKVSESLYETVCSFLNHSGGKILLGVKDDGEIIGINPEKVLSIQSSIIAAIKNAECFLPCPYFTPQIIQLDEKIVLLLDIPCGQYVYRYNGRYWDRNGDADIDVTDHPALLLSLFERKNPHLFEERIVESLSLKHLDDDTFRYCRNILAVKKPNHVWLQLSNEDILIRTRLAKKDEITGSLGLKYAALILFGKDDAIEEFMPRYRFEALFHMCSYAQYNDLKHFPNRYDDRRTMRCNLVKVYNQLTQFTERYLPDKFYLPSGSTQREDLRWELFREVIANLCVHSDYSTGFACYYHVFQDRVLTKNPTRLLPEIPEGVLTLQQLNNYTKNPLLVRVFHELSWVEDMGSGTRNILRYAPLYYSDYKVEIISGSQFIFSITYMKMSPKNKENVTRNDEMSPENRINVTRNDEMSLENRTNVTRNDEMSPEIKTNVLRNEEMSPKNETNVLRNEEMSPKTKENVLRNKEMSLKTEEMSQENDMEFSEEDLQVPLLAPELNKRERYKKNKRQQGIVGLIRRNSKITIEELAEKLEVNERTIRRDMEELKRIVEHVGPTKGGYWRIKT